VQPPPPAPPEPPPAPPPPPAPVAIPGHYKGLSSQLTTFEFDVIANGNAVTNLTTGQVNAGCTPPFGLSGGEIHLGTYVMPIASDATFGVDYNSGGTISGGTINGTIQYTGRTTITGHFSGPTAIGTLQVSLAFTYSGTAYACGSGLQTWSAARIG
jgi:hypothetical protein